MKAQNDNVRTQEESIGPLHWLLFLSGPLVTTEQTILFVWTHHFAVAVSLPVPLLLAPVPVPSVKPAL